MALLKTVDLCRDFGSIKAVHDVSIEIEEGKVFSIIGPNGAGKTTLFNLISGHLEPSSGKVVFRSRTIQGLKPFQTSHLGIARSFQLNNLFPALGVTENVRLAVQSRYPVRYNLISHCKKYSKIYEKAEAIVSQIGLAEFSETPAKALSHGDKRLLEIGIALATDPVLLLLDEPTSGMAPEETARMIDFIQKLKGQLTVVVIEHKMPVVMSVSDQLIVMHQGEVIANGKPLEVRENPEVKRAYLGEELQ